MPPTPSVSQDPVLSLIRPDTNLKVVFEEGVKFSNEINEESTDEQVESQPQRLDKRKTTDILTESQLEGVEILSSLKLPKRHQKNVSDTNEQVHEDEVDADDNANTTCVDLSNGLNQGPSSLVKSIAISGFDPSERGTLATIVEGLIGSTASNCKTRLETSTDESVIISHLIVSGTEEPKRTPRVLFALARGISTSYIVTENWLYASLSIHAEYSQ